MSMLQDMQRQDGSVIEEKIDSRLLSQYCISLFCTKEVSICDRPQENVPCRAKRFWYCPDALRTLYTMMSSVFR